MQDIYADFLCSLQAQKVSASLIGACFIFIRTSGCPFEWHFLYFFTFAKVESEDIYGENMFHQCLN